VEAPAPGGDALAVPFEQRVQEVVLKQAALAAAAPRTARIEPVPMDGGLKAAGRSARSTLGNTPAPQHRISFTAAGRSTRSTPRHSTWVNEIEIPAVFLFI
jgi:hypothetical protein